MARPNMLPNMQHEGRAGVKDLTPPELAHPEEHAKGHGEEHAEGHGEGRVEGGFFGSAEFLLLRPRQRALEYAVIDPLDDITPQGKIQSIRHDMRPGLRVGLGYRIPDSGWEIAGYYTYLHSRGDEITLAPPGGLLYPLLTRPGLTDSADRAVAFSRLNYNVYDLEIGKTMHVDESTQLRMYGGVRVASIQQALGATYTGRLADTAVAESRSKFDGGGPMFGTELTWKVVPSLSLFGKASGGLIYGRSSSGIYETNNGGATLYTDVGGQNNPIVPLVSLALGASYHYRGLSFSAGYQAVNWFGLIQQPNLIDDFSEGKLLNRSTDLSLDGFFFQLGYEF